MPELYTLQIQVLTADGIFAILFPKKKPKGVGFRENHREILKLFRRCRHRALSP